MTTIALGSVKGAPGVTTTVLAMAAVWPQHRRLLVVEIDPDGGVLAARRGLGFEPGLVGLAAAIRRRGTDVAAHTQALGDNVRVIVAPATADQVRASLAAAGERLWPTLRGTGERDVLVDCGRLSAPSSAVDVAQDIDHTLLLARPRLEDAALVRDRVVALRRDGVSPRILLIDDGPYLTGEMAAAIDAPVVGRLPIDHRTADALNGITTYNRIARSRLLRTVRALVTQLADPSETVGSPAPADPAGPPALADPGDQPALTDPAELAASPEAGAPPTTRLRDAADLTTCAPAPTEER